METNTYRLHDNDLANLSPNSAVLVVHYWYVCTSSRIRPPFLRISKREYNNIFW